jgi:hypothetical protein
MLWNKYKAGIPLSQQSIFARYCTMKRPPKKLLDQVCDAIRRKYYPIHTEEAYVAWVKRYILFHNKQHPREMGNAKIEAFSTHLAVDQKGTVPSTCPLLWNAST